MTILLKVIHKFNTHPIKWRNYRTYKNDNSYEAEKTAGGQGHPKKNSNAGTAQYPTSGHTVEPYHYIVVPAQKQTHKLMSQNRVPRDKPTPNSFLIFDKVSKNTLRKNSLFTTQYQENWYPDALQSETRAVALILHKSTQNGSARRNDQMDQKPSCKSKNSENASGKHKPNFSRLRNSRGLSVGLPAGLVGNSRACQVNNQH